MRIETMLEALVGNGQPGLIHSMKSRLQRLEVYLAMAIGGGTVIAWLSHL